MECYNSRLMKYETIRGVRLPKVGFGTWKIGGEYSARPAEDARALAALRTALDLGYTHFDTAELYADGHAEELIGRAVRETGAKRETLFITSKVKPEHLEYHQVLRSCEASLRRLGMDFIDLYLIHWSRLGMRLPETFRALNKLVRDGKVRHLGVSNFNLKLLTQSQELSETPLLTNQVPYSVSDRSYVRNGMLAYCQQSDVPLTAYSPLEQGHFKSSRTLESIAEAHGVTPQQVAIAWLVLQPRVITIPMSVDPAHIKENIEAADLELSASEMEQLSNLSSR